MSSRSVAESLQVSEVEAESGDALSKLDYSSDSPSRPNSDIADVSIVQLHGWDSVPLGFAFLVQIFKACDVLSITDRCCVSIRLCVTRTGF